MVKVSEQIMTVWWLWRSLSYFLIGTTAIVHGKEIGWGAHISAQPAEQQVDNRGGQRLLWAIGQVGYQYELGSIHWEQQMGNYVVTVTAAFRTMSMCSDSVIICDFSEQVMIIFNVLYGRYDYNL